ncbi:MAG: hypothetical protein ACK553_06400 [Planctomycetota bacterium]
MDKSNEFFLISKEADFDLICSPVRASVLEILVAFGPMPIREIAGRLGRSATLIHHHVGILFRGGLLREHAREKRGKHIERVFAVTTEDWRYDFDTNPEQMAAGMLRIARTWGRHAERLLTKALKKNQRVTPSMRRFLTARAETGYLSEHAAQSVRDHLAAIRRIFEQERKKGGGAPFHVFWNYFPMAEDAPKEKNAGRSNSTDKPKAKRPKSKPKTSKTSKKPASKPARNR